MHDSGHISESTEKECVKMYFYWKASFRLRQHCVAIFAIAELLHTLPTREYSISIQLCLQWPTLTVT